MKPYDWSHVDPEPPVTEARRSGAVDPERLARAMEDVFPGWLEEAPGSVEAQTEMRSYAEQLVRAYDFLADSASNDGTTTHVPETPPATDDRRSPIVLIYVAAAVAVLVAVVVVTR